MPTNLPQRAKAKWAEAVAAREPATKLRLLREFYSSFPKHKGTEKLEMSIKRQISSLEEEVERAKSKRRGSTRVEWVVKKEEAVQLALMGTLQTLLSFFKTVVGLDVRVHDILVSPAVGVFRGAAASFQLILTPFDGVLGDEKQERFMTVARNADAIVVLIDREPIAYLMEMFRWFEEHNIEVRADRSAALLRQASAGGIRVVGSSRLVSEREIVEFLSSYGIHNAVIEVSQETTLDDVEVAVFGREAKTAVFLLLKEARLEELRRSPRPHPLQQYIADRRRISQDLGQVGVN